MITTTHTAPITEIRIDENTMRVPPGFTIGADCQQPGGSYRYVIRDRDGASILVRPTPCADELTSMEALEKALNAACDAAYVESFARELGAHQERLGKTQEEMASLLGVSNRTYWQWVKGLGNPLVVTMEGAIARLKKANR